MAGTSLHAARAGDIPLRYRSPDKGLVAVIVPTGDDLGAKSMPGDSAYECRVEIYNDKGRRLWSLDFSSPDQDHGRGVAFARWSPDSRFFVFSTTSSGGHHPWQYYTYAYSRPRNALFLLDEFMGEVLDPKFSFARPDVITLKIFDRSIKNPKEDWPSLMVSAGLQKLLAGKKPESNGVNRNPPMYSPYQ
jgi:hypothetical protein